MIEIFRHLIGKRLRDPITGVISPIVKDVRMEHMVEPDSPSNDWWGHEWDELCVIFNESRNLDYPFISPMPAKDCVKFDVI